MSEEVRGLKDGQAGYTLLELMIVLAVLSVMFLLLIPSINGLYQRFELDVASRVIVSDLRAAQVSAWAHQDVHELWLNKFDPPQYRLWEDGRATGQVRLLDRVRYRNGYLENGVSLLRFYPNGTTVGSGNIRLINRQKDQADLIVYPSTGHVVYDGVHR
jgi:prepilin-type N-terminal cleavage/methylation domain-containing protein